MITTREILKIKGGRCEACSSNNYSFVKEINFGTKQITLCNFCLIDLLSELQAGINTED